MTRHPLLTAGLAGLATLCQGSRSMRHRAGPMGAFEAPTLVSVTRRTSIQRTSHG